MKEKQKKNAITVLWELESRWQSQRLKALWHIVLLMQTAFNWSFHHGLLTVLYIPTLSASLPVSPAGPALHSDLSAEADCARGGQWGEGSVPHHGGHRAARDGGGVRQLQGRAQHLDAAHPERHAVHVSEGREGIEHRLMLRFRQFFLNGVEHWPGIFSSIYWNRWAWNNNMEITPDAFHSSCWVKWSG